MTRKNKKSEIPPTASLGEEELFALYRIGKALNSTLDMDRVLDIVINSVTGLLNADTCSVMLLDKEGYLVIKASHGLSEEIIRSTRIRPGDGIAGWVAKTGEDLLLDGAVDDPRFVNLVKRKERVESSLCVPLKNREKVTGVFMLNRYGSDTFNQHHRYMLSLIADQLAIAISNASMYEEEKERTQELEFLICLLRKEKSRMETILSSMADGVVVTEPDGEIVMINRASERLLNVTSRLLTGKHFDRLFPRKSIFHRIRSAVVVDSGRFSEDIEIRVADQDVHYRILANAIRKWDGSPEGIVVVIHNITELKQIDQMKSDFISMVSHELKTPLTTIMGFSNLMLLKNFPRKRQERYLKIIMDDSARLLRLINNLLDISRIESGQLEFKQDKVKLEHLISLLLESLEAQTDRHVFKMEIQGDIPSVMADKDMLINVLNNLLVNAVKYSPGGGDVIVGISRIDGHILISVKDQGLGIPEDQMSIIFDKYYRVRSHIDGDSGGTGLGLATAKYIVEGFGGKIWVESELGKGSIFYFTLPLDI